MTELLLSVRCPAEATAALRAGVRALDLKDPAAGPLGRPAPGTVGRVLEALPGRDPPSAAQEGLWVSVALGELGDGALGDGEAAACALEYRAVAGRVSAFKVGLAGEVGRPWGRRLSELRGALRRLAPGAALVPVAYADRHAARSPDPGEVLAFAAAEGWPLVALDTFLKDGRTARHHLGDRRLASWVAGARAQGVEVGVAGSLGIEDVRVVAAWSPRLVAVRGAACRGGHRQGGLDPARVRALLEAVRQGVIPIAADALSGLSAGEDALSARPGSAAADSVSSRRPRLS